MTFGTRLRQSMETRGRLCVGIDPHPALLEAWGLTDSVFGLEKFTDTVVEALAGLVPVLKPQSAFFERHGSAGVAVLERAVPAARGEGCLVLLDVKRGDIGSTSQAYADAYLDQGSPLAADAITVSPYLGMGSLAPIIETALAHDAGVFVLALTSNPEGAQVQHAVDGSRRAVAASVLAAVGEHNRDLDDLGSVGAVVGATISLPDGWPEDAWSFNGPLLVPGIGAQGGTLDDVRRIFGPGCPRVLPSSSREVLAAGPGKVELREAAERALEAFSVLA